MGEGRRDLSEKGPSSLPPRPHPSTSKDFRPVGRPRERSSFPRQERERERESLTYQTNTSNKDSFSLISYIYRKIPEPDPDRFYRLSSSVAYPFSYPFFASRLSFPKEFPLVTENKNFSEKISFFSVRFPFSLRTELPSAMIPPAWSAGVFFIYGCVPPPIPDNPPYIRAPPPRIPPFGQTPEASLRRCACGYA